MIPLSLLLLTLHAPASAAAAATPITAFRSHAGPPVHLSPQFRELGLGMARTFASPFYVRGAEAAILGGAGLLAVLLQPIDQALYNDLHVVTHISTRHPGVFNYTLYLGEGWCDATFFALFSIGGAKERRVTVEGLEALAAVAVESTIEKRLFRVPRPDKTPHLKQYFQRFFVMDSKNDAFPSGHTMSAFATAAVISEEYPMASPVAYGAASLVGLSVMEKGWHWPSDVVFGAAMGYVIGRGAVIANQNLHIGLGPSPEGVGLAANGHF